METRTLSVLRGGLVHRLRSESWNASTLILVLVFHGLAFAALWQPFRWSYLPLMVLAYLWFGFSVTLYLHRALAHRGLELPIPLRFVFAMGAAVGLAGDPVGWVGFHRHHHQVSETEDDIHSPRHGLWYSHALWLHKIKPQVRDALRELANDVRQDAFCRWMENLSLYFLPHLLVTVALYLTLGLSGLLWVLYVPLVLVYHVSQTINSLCHAPSFGYRRFDTPDDSRNVAWLALVSLGESFHNNHHAKPQRVAHGLERSELDTTKGLIVILERLGLARNVHW